MNTHTQETWHLGKRAGNPAIYGKDGTEIAEILHVLNDDWKGNAKLICAAPDLLAACKAALALMQDPDADEYFDATRLEYMLEDAILKAEGKQ